MFDIVDKDGWTGVEAPNIEAAKLACLTLATEGYELPLGIVPEGETTAVLELVGPGNMGTGEWRGGRVEHVPSRPKLTDEGRAYAFTNQGTSIVCRVALHGSNHGWPAPHVDAAVLVCNENGASAKAA